MMLLKDIKSDLKSETWWHTSEIAEQIGRAGVFINMHCDLILDLLEVPPNGKLKKIAIDLSKSLVENAINQEKFSIDMAIGLLSEISIFEKYTYGKLVIDLGLAFKNYGEKLSDLTQIDVDRKKVMNEVNEQLARIETELYRYQMEIKKSDELIKAKEFIVKKNHDYKKRIN